MTTGYPLAYAGGSNGPAPGSGDSKLNVEYHRMHRAVAAVLAGLALAILCGLFFAWLGEEVLDGETLHFDNRILALVHGDSRPALTQGLLLVTWIGSTAPVIALTLVALAVFWLRNRRRDAVVLAITIVGASVLMYFLKIGFHRVRPPPYFGLAPLQSFSFPSGHSLVAFCFYGVLAHLVNSRIQQFAVRAGIWALAVLMVLLIGFSRIYLGFHYPTDVLAGYAAGIVWVFAIVLAEPLIGRHKNNSIKERYVENR
ncbi:MAG: phosphatase PAP2 family protein [Bryobacteraceae bacterium]